MNYLQFAAWRAYLTTEGTYLVCVGYGSIFIQDGYIQFPRPDITKNINWQEED